MTHVVSAYDQDVTAMAREIGEKICHEVEVFFRECGHAGVIVISHPDHVGFWQAHHPVIQVTITLSRAWRTWILTIRSSMSDYMDALALYLSVKFAIHAAYAPPR